MIFNGLSKSDLVVYNALVDLLNVHQLPINARLLADQTCYSERTIYSVLNRLVDWKMVRRRREKTGVPYEYRILDE